MKHRKVITRYRECDLFRMSLMPVSISQDWIDNHSIVCVGHMSFEIEFRKTESPCKRCDLVSCF